jgi:hypothetical protein
MHGLGSLMLDTYMQSVDQNLITAHTRNPALLGMLGKVCGLANVYPLAKELVDLHADVFVNPLIGYARQVPHTTVEPERHAAYHVDRYDEGGLYGKEDPTDAPIKKPSTIHGGTLKEAFPGLRNPRTALVVVADYNRRRYEINYQKRQEDRAA